MQLYTQSLLKLLYLLLHIVPPRDPIFQMFYGHGIFTRQLESRITFHYVLEV